MEAILAVQTAVALWQCALLQVRPASWTALRRGRGWQVAGRQAEEAEGGGGTHTLRHYVVWCGQAARGKRRRPSADRSPAIFAKQNIPREK